jgi:hypothetical protein
MFILFFQQENETSSEAEDEGENESSVEESESDSNSKEINNHVANNHVAKNEKPAKTSASKPQNDLDLLLDLNFDSVSSGYSSNFSRCSALYVPERFFSILSPLTSDGLLIEGRFNRSPSVFSNSMLNTEIQVSFNTKGLQIADIHLQFDKVCFFLSNNILII